MAKTPSISSEAEPATNEPDPRIPTDNKDEGDESSDGDDDEGNESGNGDDESGESSDDEEEEKPESDSKKLNPSTSTPIPSKAPAESDESESESESEPEPDNKKLDLSTSTPVPSKASAESDESESESESESDSEAAKLVTPISSKPMPEIGSPVSKPPVVEKSNGGKPLFQRIWSLDDEIAILKALAQFEAQHGPVKLNASAIGEFHAFVKGSLSLEVSDSQLVEKIRRLKKKYSGLDAREKKSKKALKFAKVHDQNVYELSKKVWGQRKDDDESKARARSVNKNSNGVLVKCGGGSLKRGYPFLKDAVMKMKSSVAAAEALERIDSEKGRSLEKKLKKQKLAEVKHDMHGMDLLKETVKLVMESLERARD